MASLLKSEDGPWTYAAGEHDGMTLDGTYDLGPIARACILKWLEQEPTPTMLNAVREIPTGNSVIAKRDFKAMCAQAAKQLTE